MPFFFIDIGIENLEIKIAELIDNKKIVIFYSPVSLIEIKWENLRIEKNDKNPEELNENYQLGLKALETDNNSHEIPLTDIAVDSIATQLRKQGHKDYFDTVIASKAILYSNFFLALDKQLITQIEVYYNNNAINREDRIVTGNWNKLLEYINSSNE